MYRFLAVSIIAYVGNYLSDLWIYSVERYPKISFTIFQIPSTPEGKHAMRPNSDPSLGAKAVLTGGQLLNGGITGNAMPYSVDNWMARVR